MLTKQIVFVLRTHDLICYESHLHYAMTIDSVFHRFFIDCLLI